MKRAAPVHYLRPNEKEWSPPSLISFDVETAPGYEGQDEIHTMRLWCARFTDRRQQRKGILADEWEQGYTGIELACAIHVWCMARKTTWAYAHNLHFDLCVSSMAEHLVEYGWRVTDFAVDSRSPFVRLERQGHHLTIADSWSWLPTGLVRVGEALGLIKPDLPSFDGGTDEWFARCRADVDILSSAMLTLMRWWDKAKLGNWAITGGAAGWNCFRHKGGMRQILIDPDPAKCAADRKAIYGGARGCTRTGELEAGEYAELDFVKAYTVICRDLPLPIERMAAFDSLPLDHPWLTSSRLGIIATVLIETSVPRWPVRHGQRIWYPVGRFWTTLAAPDIAEALRLGCLRQIGAGYVHKLGFAMRQWAEWVIASQSDTTGAVPQVAKITLKHWGRAVVGKTAQRGYERIQLGPSPTRTWGFTEAWNHTQDCRASVVDFGGQRWQVSAAGDPDNAYPAILAFVESWVRVMLGRAIDRIGREMTVSWDTDGVIVRTGLLAWSPLPSKWEDVAYYARWDRRDIMVERVNQETSPLELRVKQTYRDVTIIGPQHLVTDDKTRMAGIPASAERSDDGTLRANLWPKMTWQMRYGAAGTYRRPYQEYRLAAVYAPGWVAEGGAVLPLEMWTAANGSNHLIPWSWSSYARSGARLAASQHPALERWARHADHAGHPANT